MHRILHSSLLLFLPHNILHMIPNPLSSNIPSLLGLSRNLLRHYRPVLSEHSLAAPHDHISDFSCSATVLDGGGMIRGGADDVEQGFGSIRVRRRLDL